MALRLGLGLVMVFGLGYLVDRMAGASEHVGADPQLAEVVASREAIGAFARWVTILGRMAVRLIPEYVVLVLLLGATRAWLFPHVGPEIGNTLWWILVFALAGTLFVVPTAGEVPIVQAMFSLGIGAGPAGALLMTLPPVSLPSLVMVAPSFRPRMLIAVTAGVIAVGILGGLLAAGLKL